MSRALYLGCCVVGTVFAAWIAATGEHGMAAFEMFWILALAANLACEDRS